MQYEIVELQEKIIAGISARTNNTSPDMSAVITSLWQRFYEGGVYSKIEGKTTEKPICAYTDYAGDEKADYTAMVACEVWEKQQDAKLELRRIPAGRYAKFVCRGHVIYSVVQFWQELWKADLPRSFVCDFEEYQNCDMENCEIHIYIGLKI